MGDNAPPDVATTGQTPGGFHPSSICRYSSGTNTAFLQSDGAFSILVSRQTPESVQRRTLNYYQRVLVLSSPLQFSVVCCDASCPIIGRPAATFLNHLSGHNDFNRQNNYYGQLGCGHVRLDILGPAIDLVGAAKDFKLPAGQNHSDAQFIYGCCLQSGQGVPVDFVGAAKYYKLAADQNHSDAQFIGKESRCDRGRLSTGPIGKDSHICR